MRSRPSRCPSARRDLEAWEALVRSVREGRETGPAEVELSPDLLALWAATARRDVTAERVSPDPTTAPQTVQKPVAGPAQRVGLAPGG